MAEFPQSREEAILQATINGEEYTGLPESRIEELLLELKAIIESGGGSGATTLSALTDTSISSPSDGQILGFNGITGKWENQNPSGGGVATSVVGTVESGTTASQPYAVGEHFIRNDKFCTAIATIASGATLTLNTNYVEGTIAEAIEDLTSYLEQTVTLSTSAETTATFTSAKITANSLIDLAVSEWGLIPSNVVVASGTCTVTMPKVDSAHSVVVRIYVR